MTTLAQYERARAALAEIKSLPEAVTFVRGIEHLRLHAKQVQDRTLMAEAAEIQFKAEVVLGEMLAKAKENGHLREGRPKKNDTNFESFSLKDLKLTARQSMAAQHKASISERAQLAMIERMRERILSGGATVIDVVAKSQEQKERRANRERVLAECQRALPDKRYGVILADPEWKHVPWSDQGMLKAADNHYPTTPTDEICARPVGNIAAPDCALFLWGTVPMLPDALKVMAAWGFTYRSHVMWRKIYPGAQQGMGYWFRVNHELLLLGTRGKIPCPAPGDNWGSVIDAETRGHSIKPDWQYELIESYFQNLPKIELNARRARAGWDAWGLEAPTDADGEPIEHDADGVIADTSERGEAAEPGPARQCQQPATQNQPISDSDLEIPAFLDRRVSGSPRVASPVFAEATAGKPVGNNAGRGD